MTPLHCTEGGSIDLQDMSRLVDAAASLTSTDDVKLQSILEQISVPDRWGGKVAGAQGSRNSYSTVSRYPSAPYFPGTLELHIVPARQPWQ